MFCTVAEEGIGKRKLTAPDHFIDHRPNVIAFLKHDLIVIADTPPAPPLPCQGHRNDHLQEERRGGNGRQDYGQVIILVLVTAVAAGATDTRLVLFKISGSGEIWCHVWYCQGQGI